MAGLGEDPVSAVEENGHDGEEWLSDPGNDPASAGLDDDPIPLCIGEWT